MGSALHAFAAGLAAGEPVFEPNSPAGRLLRAARNRFAAAGYDAATTRAIAAEAKANQAMINYYFRSKEELYRRVLLLEFQALVTSVARALDPLASAGDRLLELPLAVIEALRADPVRRRILLREWAEGGPHAARLVESLGARGPRGLKALHRELVLEAQRSGEIAPHRPEAVLRFLLASAYGFLLTEPLLAVVFEEPKRDERAWRSLLDEHRRLLRAGLAPAAPARGSAPRRGGTR